MKNLNDLLLALIPANNLVCEFGFSIFIGYRQITTLSLFILVLTFWNYVHQAWEPRCIQTNQKFFRGLWKAVLSAFRFKMALTITFAAFICWPHPNCGWAWIWAGQWGQMLGSRVFNLFCPNLQDTSTEYVPRDVTSANNCRNIPILHRTLVPMDYFKTLYSRQPMVQF